MPFELVVEGLSKAFAPGARVVDDVRFVVPAGEIAVLLGPSGCGKTTLLRMIAGLETPDAGSVCCGDRVYSDASKNFFLPPQYRNLGMVFQSYAIWPHMSVAQNVEYPLRRRKMTRAERQARVRETLTLVGLSHLGSRPSSALSGGQMQRVALARSMAYRPDLLLLDEPMSNLDPELRTRLRADLRAIVKSSGLTAIYVTHDQEEAAAIGDIIGVMSAGRMLQFAPKSKLFGCPRLPEVARFTGATNIIRGVVTRRTDHGVQIRIGEGIEIPATAVEDLATGDAAQILFRPENVRLNRSREGVPARVVESQFLGGQSIYGLELAGHRIEARDLGTELRWAVGDTAGVSIAASGVWAFRLPDQPGNTGTGGNITAAVQ